MYEVSEDKGAKQIVSQLRSWVNAPSLNRFSGLWLLNYAPGWPTPRGTSDAARPRPSATRPYQSERAHSPLVTTLVAGSKGRQCSVIDQVSDDL